MGFYLKLNTRDVVIHASTRDELSAIEERIIAFLIEVGVNPLSVGFETGEARQLFDEAGNPVEERLVKDDA